MYIINKHEGDHHWCQWFRMYPSTSLRMWIEVLNLNTQRNISIRGHWWKPTVESEGTCPWGMEASRYLTWFLSTIPGWCVYVDRDRIVEGGLWWLPHHRHETWNKRWCWSDENNHRIDLDMIELKEGKEAVEGYWRGGFHWTLNDTKNDLEALTQWGMDQT